MLLRKIKVWLYWAFPYSNAGKYFLKVLHVADPNSNIVSFEVVLPQQDLPGIQLQDPFPKWYSDDPKIATYLRAHPEILLDSTYTLLNSNVIKDGIAFIKGRIVIFRWESQIVSPTIDVLSEKDLPLFSEMKFHHVVPAVEGTSFGSMPLKVKGGKDKWFYGDVSLDYAHAHSLFPKEALKLLEGAFPAEMKPLTNGFECRRLRNLALPKFEFQSAGNTLFTLTKPNYFVRSNHDGKCYMAVRVNTEKNKWVIGAALAKTHETVFRIRYSSGAPTYEYKIFRFVQSS
ncbi:unnamed protein product [Albugo candida]|uniref:Peptidase A1 domain-containing protein n=1 Tax=Albugo candida TaxID=65357 RepID=A0A024GAZ1_9STRA|nr:unnamed protein product [Albugo candida]|eukprot:CCI43903.1 unnamed protein product [Albugo candida]